MEFILFESSAAHVVKVPPERLNELAGRLEVFSLFELLQFFASAGKSGILRLTDAEAVEGECYFSLGRIAHAHYLHYRGEEAMLAMLCWPATSFTFHVGVELTGPPERIDLPPLLMNAARLMDQQAHFRGFFPGVDASLLAVGDPASPGDADPLECDAPTVHATICRRPLVTCEELEGTLPLAPIKIRLSIAWLCNQKRLTGSPTLSVDAQTDAVPILLPVTLPVPTNDSLKVKTRGNGKQKGGRWRGGRRGREAGNHS